MLSTWRPEELLPAFYNSQQAPTSNETAIKVLTHLRLLSVDSLTYGNVSTLSHNCTLCYHCIFYFKFRLKRLN